MSWLHSVPLMLVLVVACLTAIKLPSFESYRARMVEGGILSVAILGRWAINELRLTDADLGLASSLALFAYATLRVLRGPKDYYLLPCSALAAAALARGDSLDHSDCLLPLLCASLHASPRITRLVFVLWLLPAAFVAAH